MKLQTKELQNVTNYGSRATVVIDFGNGRVKLAVCLPGETEFQFFAFDSFVAEAAEVSKQCLSVISGKSIKNYLVGDAAKSIGCSRTGLTAGRKAEVSDLLFLHAMRLAFGEQDCKEVHCDVIFTSPSPKQYGAEIIQRLVKRHHVQIPASQYVPGSKPKNYVVEVHKAKAALEGHLACASLNKGRKVWLLDIGNRTVNATLVDSEGDILARRTFDGCGVYPICDRIVSTEALSNQLKTPSPQSVIDYLMDNAHGEDIEQAISASVGSCLSESLAFINTDDPIVVIGGGAKLPGVAKLVGGTKGKDPDFANVSGISLYAAQILGNA